MLFAFRLSHRDCTSTPFVHPLQIDGKLVQSGHTRDLVFRVPRLIACVSAVMTLSPGDLILTGTPAGVGAVLPGQVLSAGMEAGGKLVGAYSSA
jgi:2-keto-4-pentenoate hydratase/2-oxohepta-3-ene-1,7-dioic acid hydratase in catechol pathway